MKIALAHYSGISDISGVSTWLIGFCESLVKAGHHVNMHLHHFGDDPQEGSILPLLRRLGIETQSLCRTGSLEADTRQTLQFLNQAQPDLFLPQCLHAHYVAAAHAGRQGLPWIFNMHSDDPDYWCVAESLSPEINGGSSVCVSEFLAQVLHQKVPASTPQVIPYGIPIPSAFATFSNQPFRVVYSGRLVEQQKCIHQVMRTLISVCRSSSQIEADVIGDGPEREACQQLVLEASLADRIRFLGRVPPEQVPPLLARSQAILLMSDFEGLPVALLEAMACGVVPVVRTIPSGIPELVNHEQTGLLVANDPELGAAALLRLVNNPELWQHCSDSGRVLVGDSYSADHCYQNWLSLIAKHQDRPRASFPLSTSGLDATLPPHDSRFQSQYPSAPPSMSRFHPRRVLGRLRRLAHRQ
jgi:colanic acid/amylovoran biosynthesis glycosyltransferase